MKLGTTVAGGLLLFGMAGASTPVHLTATPTVSALAPSIPQPQPGPPPGSCTRTAGAADSWTKLTEDSVAGSDVNAGPRFEVAVDPSRPCLMYRATSRQDLQRSLDYGRTWQAVFHDAAGAVSSTLPGSPVDSSPFAASDLSLPRPDSLVLAEKGNGDAVVRSDDQGHSWRLADGGLEGHRVMSVDAAPSNPDVLYAVVDNTQTDPLVSLVPVPDPLGFYFSEDGGASWLPGVFPTALTTAAGQFHPRPHLAIDPDQPGHLWMLAQVTTVTADGGTKTGLPTQSVIVESQDHGQTWLPVGPPGSRVTATQLLAVRGPDHRLRLYDNVTAEAPNGGSGTNTDLTPPAVSVDDGQTWQSLPVVPVRLSSLAVDSADPNRMVYAGYVNQGLFGGGLNTLTYTVTYDGWAHAISGTPLRLGPVTAMLPVAPLHGQDYPGTQSTDDAGVLLQADRFGTFYLLSRYGDSATTHQALYALTPVGPPGTGTNPAQGAGGSAGNPQQTPPAPGSQPSQPPVNQMVALRTCQLPASDADDSKGALTFDGNYLLYTSSESVGAPNTGTILRLDPQTCAPAPSLTVQFDPADLSTAAQTAGGQGWTTPVVDTVAYDPGHDTIWMSLARIGNNGCLCYQTTPVPIFSATAGPAGGAGTSTVQAKLRFFEYGAFAPGIDLLAYDYSDDTLWSRAQGYAAHIDLDGNRLPSCWDTAQDRGDGIATWVAGGPGRLYVQSEDDVTVWEVEPSTCQLIRTFQHRNFGEPSAEDEQMACDALTFGTDSDYAQTHPAKSVLWLRDALNHLVVAYEIPDGVCPLPTTTRYLGSGTSAERAQTHFCAQLSRRGVVKHLPDKPLVFSVGGQHIGTGNTNAAGIACVDHPMSLVNGAYPVVVRFLGDAQYLPSQDTGTFPVTTGAIPPLVAVALPGQPPSSGQPPEPGPASQAQAPQAASQAETQVSAQTQAQAQSQTQAQTHTVAQAQPGVAMQRRTREQVATQTAADTAAQGNTLQAVQFAAAALTLGFGVLRRRPARARARLRRRRSR